MSDVAILIPVLGRPQRVAPLLASISAATPEPHRVLFVVSPDDVDEQAAIVEWLSIDSVGMLVMDQPRQPGDYAMKINAGLRATDEPLVFTGADDLVFHLGWLPAAQAHLVDGVGVVATNDLGNPQVVAGNHGTHSIVTRDYAMTHGTFDEPGLIYHEGYDHNYCDVEFTETARARGMWAFAEDSVVEHVHPSWGKAEQDDCYKLGAMKFREDARWWIRRRSLLRRKAAFGWV